MSKLLDSKATLHVLFDVYLNDIASKDEAEPVPVFDVKEIKTVRYADKPLSHLTSATQIKTLTRTGFEKQEEEKRKQSFHFTNNLFLPSLIKSNYSKAMEKSTVSVGDKASQKVIGDFLQGKQFVDLIICNMGKAGSGVFAYQEIPENTFITTYSGQLSSEASYKGSFSNLAYAFYSKTASPLYTQVIIDRTRHIIPKSLGKRLPFVISADKYGNYGTFFQHLPDQESLAKLGLPPEYGCYFATENIITFSYSYETFPILALLSSRKILPGEQIGYNYSQTTDTNYWSSKNTYALFNRRGEEIISVTDGKISPQDIKDLPNSVLKTELAHHTTKVNPDLVNLWQFTKKSAYLTAARPTLLPLAQKFKKMGIEIMFGPVKNSPDHMLAVGHSQYKKLLELAETEDLRPKF